MEPGDEKQVDLKCTRLSGVDYNSDTVPVLTLRMPLPNTEQRGVERKTRGGSAAAAVGDQIRSDQI